MCDAENELRYAEQTIDWLHGRLDAVIDLAADVERGIINLAEFRHEAQRLRAERMSRV